MKKSYVKPMIDFESFELAEFVAACNAHENNGSFNPSVCKFFANFYMVENCTIDAFGDEHKLFLTGNNSCTDDPTSTSYAGPPIDETLNFFRS